MQNKADPFIMATSGQPTDLEDWGRPAQKGWFGGCHEKLSAGHQLRQSVTVHLARRVSSDFIAVSQHGDALRDAHDLFQLVTNENRSDPVRLEAMHCLQKSVDLMMGERCGRFVHHHQTSFRRQRTTDRNELADGDRQPGNYLFQWEIESETSPPPAQLSSH